MGSNVSRFYRHPHSLRTSTLRSRMLADVYQILLDNMRMHEIVSEMTTKARGLNARILCTVVAIWKKCWPTKISQNNSMWEIMHIEHQEPLRSKVEEREKGKSKHLSWVLVTSLKRRSMMCSGRSLYRIFVHHVQWRGIIFKGYLPPGHKLRAPYNYFILLYGLFFTIPLLILPMPLQFFVVYVPLIREQF